MRSQHNLYTATVILPTAGLFLFLAFDARPADGGPERPANAVSAPVGNATETLLRIDALHRRRDDPAAFKEERQLVAAALARSSNDFEFLWRAARTYFWLSDDPSTSNEQRSQLGKTGWDLAERAISAAPKKADGYYWSALNLGSYALGLGVVKALTMGLEGKFTGRLKEAGQLSPGYEFGGVDVAWGRFYEKLPWPKRDRKKAEEHLRRVLTSLNARSLRARVFLADTLLQDGRAEEAKVLLDQVEQAKVGAYDAPEERRAKALEIGVMANVRKKLK